MVLRWHLFVKGECRCHADICSCCRREVCFAFLRNHKAEFTQLSNQSSHLHRDCLMNVQRIIERPSLTLTLQVWSYFIIYREILGTVYTQLKNYPAIIYWLTETMNSWDYHTTLLLTIFFQFLNFFLVIFCYSVTSNYHLNNYSLSV